MATTDPFSAVRRLGNPVRRVGRAARSVVLTGRGIGFLVGGVLSFIAAPVLSLPALLYVTGLLLTMVVLSALFVLVGHSRVVIERSFAPQVVSPGLMSRATVRVTNLSLLPSLEARWDDHLPHGVTGESSGLLPALGGSHSDSSRVSFSYGLQGLRRGRHAIGPLQINVIDPFGLVSRRHSFGVAESLTVLPRRLELPAIARRGASDDGATRPSPQHVDVGNDDTIARLYAPGDALKRLHWKATAHRGELMVRQEEQQINLRAVVLLDCQPRSQGTARDNRNGWEHSSSFEWSIVAVASIVSHLTRAGYVVAAQSNGTMLDRHVADGHDTVEDAMVDLAVLEPEERDNDRAPITEEVAFLVLGRLDEDRARHWLSTVAACRTVLALVAAGSSPAALDLLEDARWRVVTYHSRDNLAEAWSELDGARAHAAG